MKLTTGIVFLAITAGTALGQNPTVINNTKATLQASQPSGNPQKSGAPATRISAKAAPKAKPAAARQKSEPKQQIAVENQKKPAEAKADKPAQVNMTSRRDPFVSPVVNRSMIGSGCSTGKRCLAIDQINLKGVVKADSGMIAVVVNSLNKAYFLRENDPVFNGFVVKITGDSIIFKESVQDRLGKPFMREVTKKITTSAV
jgi:Tfp pilus assembly protein PilP